MNFQKIGFIGLGLIGGSIAKTIKKFYPETKLLALASRQATIDAAYKDGLVINSQLPKLDDFKDCDLIFFCSPVGVNVDYLKKLKPIISDQCLLTDVGSVKGDIHKAISELGLEKQFIGGHPMAGSEAIGYANSTDHMLENAYYILTYDTAMDLNTVLNFEDYIKSLGSLTMKLTPKEHDFATAAISHVPHIISASLVNLVNDNDNQDAVLKTIAAGGFKDITRISSSSPVMWQHICMTNRDEILKLTDVYMEEFNQFREAIKSSDPDRIISLFSKAKDYRDSLPVRNTGMLPSVYEFYVDLIDEAGGIATISTILAVHGISLKNIGIIHNREYEQGVLHIEVYDEDSMIAAKALLRAQNYIVYDK